ncbi:MAG: HD domain-containing protein [Sedimentibacter sp.]
MKRINNILQNVEFLKYLQKNIRAEEDRIYCRHDIAHFLDVSRIAYIITLEEKLNIQKEVLYAMGLLHDIGRWMEYENGVDHAAASKQLSEEILKACDFNESEIAAILSAIGTHRHKGQMSVLGDILYRADKLSRNCVLCSARITCKNFQNGEEPVLIY